MTTKRSTAAVCMAALLSLALLSGSAAAQGKFFLRAGTGVSFPSIENLDNELGAQERDKLSPGYAFGISLGRAFSENRWSLEINFSTAFYADFEYENDYEAPFTGKLRHYGYMGILRRHWLQESRWAKPSFGLGAGYGVTNLVSGGGKMGAPEALAALRIDSAIRPNLSLAIEGIYTIGLQTKPFKGPFLENVDTDAVMTSGNEVLEDKYDSFEIRIGITAWLKTPLED